MIINNIKFFYRKLQNMILNIFYYDDKSVCLFWYKKPNNFGDVISPILINKLFNKKVKYVNYKHYNKDFYLAIGSILEQASKKTIVWGSGFMASDSKCIEKPKKILAVRGPKTREVLLERGIDCPEVYGDPALLLPKIYNPKIEKKYRLGIVPHYVDKNNKWLAKLDDHNEVLILNILEKNPYKFIDALLSCEKIASSSLHGIITSDAYGIPSIWLEFSKNIAGEGFKFQDYFLSVGRTDKNPLIVNEYTTLDNIYKSFYHYSLNIDLEKLLRAAPFKR